MKQEYEPKSDIQRLAYLIEECGEVLAAAGKSLRWGLQSVNPELPEDEQETNADWLARELRDLECAVGHAWIVLDGDAHRSAYARGRLAGIEEAAALAAMWIEGEGDCLPDLRHAIRALAAQPGREGT